MPEYILSIYFGFHDSNISISSSTEVLLHLEAERVFRKKHMRFESKEQMIELIAIGLEHLNLTIDQIKTVYLAKWNNKFEDGDIEILGKKFSPILTSHHFNHIGCTYPAGFQDSIIVCADGGSEDGTTKIYHKQGNHITLLEDLDATPMTGKFYGTLTQMIITPRFGRAHDTEPGKTMGLAGFGAPNEKFAKLIVENQMELNKLHFNNVDHLMKVFGISPDYSKPWEDQNRRDLAYEGQKFWVETFLNKIICLSNLSKNVCLVGGCAMNVILNSELVNSKKFQNVYISPVSSDCGQSIGAILFHHPEIRCKYPYLGRGFGELTTLPDYLIDDLLNHKIIAWYQGRSESGARALGHRSFIGLPDSLEIKKRLSQDIKKREPYRPVAPIIAEEYLEEFFNTTNPSPYMTFSPEAFAITKEKAPAIVHADGTSRMQTLSQSDNPVLHETLQILKEKTGVPIIMNSSLNIMGEPIVDTPEDALKNFMDSEADVLYLNGKRYLK